MFLGISPAMPPSLTGITEVSKVADQSVCKFSAIFVGVSETHLLTGK